MTVFDELKRAWRQAVENFWHELESDDADGRDPGVYREVSRVRSQREELDAAIAETRQRRDEELEQVRACARRERLAHDIGDTETARVAAEYRARHQERANVLHRKQEALEAERRLCARDLEEMERALQQDLVAKARADVEELNRHPMEGDFRNLENAERSRSAEERLAELKRRMAD